MWTVLLNRRNAVRLVHRALWLRRRPQQRVHADRDCQKQCIFSIDTSARIVPDAAPSFFYSTRWNVIQHDLLPELRDQVGTLMPTLEKVIHTLEWVRLEEFTQASWCGFGRPPHERAWLANAFVAKSVLGLTTTTALIERLGIDRALRRICSFPLCRKLPSEATFSRALAVC